MPENDERDESPDMPSRASDKGWSLWGLVRAGWNAKEDASITIQPGQGISMIFNLSNNIETYIKSDIIKYNFVLIRISAAVRLCTSSKFGTKLSIYSSSTYNILE